MCGKLLISPVHQLFLSANNELYFQHHLRLHRATATRAVSADTNQE